MNDTLLKAILSLDAYNRGYGEAIKLPVVLNSTQIGNVTIVAQSDTNSEHDAFKAGFYAIAYKDNVSGSITISYRGTDNPLGLKGNDVLNGWVGGAGFITSQDGLAFAFYNDVAKQQNNNTAIDPRNANISLTGHSLGGGLAGLAASNDNHRATKLKVA